ncbi:MAG: Rrf2 family transcriptional regulator [Planctomycetes bacterium]|nr:Rrf2 family transcriptional regulator [Planctomycetota bacterium]
MYLAQRRENSTITLNEITDKLFIPKAFLSKILQQLSRKGLIRSLKGPSGGFILAVDPAELTLNEIVIEVDGDQRVFECFGLETSCNLTGDCRIHDVFKDVELEVTKVLAGYSLADLMAEKTSKLGS